MIKTKKELIKDRDKLTKLLLEIQKEYKSVPKWRFIKRAELSDDFDWVLWKRGYINDLIVYLYK